MSYHVKGDVRFKDLPERILVREDGYMTAYVFEGEPIADYWYVPESECLNLRTENAKLRELVSWMYDRMDESCAVQYPYAPTPISYDRLMQAQARACELGVEVDG